MHTQAHKTQEKSQMQGPWHTVAQSTWPPPVGPGIPDFGFPLCPSRFQNCGQRMAWQSWDGLEEADARRSRHVAEPALGCRRLPSAYGPGLDSLEPLVLQAYSLTSYQLVPTQSQAAGANKRPETDLWLCGKRGLVPFVPDCETQRDGYHWACESIILSF